VLRAGLTDALVTGMATSRIRVSVRPIARGANPAGAPAHVVPITTNTKKNVRACLHLSFLIDEPAPIRTQVMHPGSLRKEAAQSDVLRAKAAHAFRILRQAVEGHPNDASLQRLYDEFMTAMQAYGDDLIDKGPAAANRRFAAVVNRLIRQRQLERGLRASLAKAQDFWRR
jgi:hypothetical protein